jgi:hypothetical protein
MGHSLTTASVQNILIHRLLEESHGMGYAIAIAPTDQSCVQFYYSLPFPNCHGIQTTNDKSFVNPLDAKLKNKKKKKLASCIISLIDVCQMDSDGFGLALFRLVDNAHPSARHDQPPIKICSRRSSRGSPLVLYSLLTVHGGAIFDSCLQFSQIHHYGIEIR